MPTRIPTLLVSLLTVACHRDVALDEARKAPEAEWSKVVRAVATKDGLKWSELAAHQDTLEDYLGWASTHGQHSNSWGESKEDKRVAYLLNVHNAAVLHSMGLHGLPDSPDEVVFGIFQWPGSGFYWGTRYRVDNEWTSLAHLASHDTVHRYQEPLLWLGLYDGTQDSPPLRWWTSKRKKLLPQLKRAARAFINSERGMRPEGEGWTVNPLFIKHARDFTDWTEATTLCEWMAGYAKGSRKAWLNDQGTDCTLRAWDPRRGLDRAPGPSPSSR